MGKGKKLIGALKDIGKHVIGGSIAHALWDGVRDGVPTMIAWLTGALAHVKGLPLYVDIIIGVVIFVLSNVGLAIRDWRRERKLERSNTDSPAPQITDGEKDKQRELARLETSARKTRILALETKLEADSWLHRIAEFDRRNIEQRVSIGQCIMSSSDVTGSPPYVLFLLDIYNCSVFDVFIEDKTEGYIKFRDKELDGPIIPRNSYTMDIPRGNHKVFAIEQRLGTLAEFVKTHWDKRDSFFTFNSLKIKIRGIDDSQGVEPKYLSTDNSVSSNGNLEREQCPDTWLHIIADDQAHNIIDYVEIKPDRMYDDGLDSENPSIKFHFFVRNHSIYPVGFVTENLKLTPVIFRGKQLTGELRCSEYPTRIPSNETVRLTIEQGVGKNEADSILEWKKNPDRDANYCFAFLGLAIAGTSEFPRVRARTVNIRERFDVNGNITPP